MQAMEGKAETEPEKPPDEEADPDWFDGKKIDESMFSNYLIARHPMKCVNGILYDKGGMMNEQRLQKEIYDMITPYIRCNVAKNVTKLVDAMKIRAFCEMLPAQTDRIHIANGTLYLDGRFEDELQFCQNRLPVAYIPDAPKPERWLKFLSELLEADDIPTLQEFMGYVLIPTNRAQTMMLKESPGSGE